MPYNLLTDNDIKERIHSGCFQAVAASCRYAIKEVNNEDDYGVDFNLVKLRNRGTKIRDCGSVLDFQLKASKSWTEKDNCITYKLENKTLNDIRQRNREGDLPLVLVLLCVPEDCESIVSINDDSISIHKKMYWYHCDQEDPIENENSKTTIYIPLEQVFAPTTFCDIISTFGLEG